MHEPGEKHEEEKATGRSQQRPLGVAADHEQVHAGGQKHDGALGSFFDEHQRARGHDQQHARVGFQRRSVAEAVKHAQVVDDRKRAEEGRDPAHGQPAADMKEHELGQAEREEAEEGIPLQGQSLPVAGHQTRYPRDRVIELTEGHRRGRVAPGKTRHIERKGALANGPHQVQLGQQRKDRVVVANGLGGHKGRYP